VGTPPAPLHFSVGRTYSGVISFSLFFLPQSNPPGPSPALGNLTCCMFKDTTPVAVRHHGLVELMQSVEK